jgi:hypothetical protein
MAVVMAPFLVCVLACLDAPIGNPETSKVDPKLSGVWLGRDHGDLTLLVMQPFDKRTYLVGWFGHESDEELDEVGNLEKEVPRKKEAKLKDSDVKLDQIVLGGGMMFKGWLTTIGGQQFMCWEPKFVLNSEKGMKPKEWFAWKVKLKKNKLSLAIIDGKAAGKNTKEIEKLIKANYLDNSNLKDKDWTYFEKIDKSEYGKVAKALEKMGIGELK